MSEPKSTPDSYLIVGGVIQGRHAASLLAQRGETRVAIFDSMVPRERAYAFPVPDSVEMLMGDITDATIVSATVKSFGATCIIHTGLSLQSQSGERVVDLDKGLTKAAQVNALKKWMDESAKTKIETTRHLIEASRAYGVTKFVYMSDADIFFDGSERPMLNEWTATLPTEFWTKYHEHTAQGELLTLRANRRGDLRTAVIRPAEFFGAGSSAIYRSIAAMQRTPEIPNMQVGDNTNLVDHTHFANAAHALILAADRLSPAHPKHSLVAGRAFFITDGEPRPFFNFYRSLWKELTGEVAKRNGQPVVGRKMTLFASYLRGDPPEMRRRLKRMCSSRSYDISLARQVLDYTPIVSHDEGIRDTIKWYREMKAGEKTGMTEAPPPYIPTEGDFFTEKSPFL